MEKNEKNTVESNVDPQQSEELKEKDTVDQVEEAKEKKKKKKGKKKSKQSKKEEKLIKEIEEKEQQLGELKDKYLRLFAEFENYKKRTIREKVDLMKSAAQETLSSLLPILDDFDRAKKSAEREDSREVFSEGVQLVYNKLYKTLNQRGLEAMETNGQPFDPEFHEAITEIPAPNDDLKGKIIDTIEKGYLLNEKIIRHAKVVVGR